MVRSARTARSARRIESAQFHTDFSYVAVNKDAFPNSPASVAGCIKSFRLPKQAQVSSVSFQAQYQAFVRFAVGSGAASKAIALKGTCVLEPFTRGGLSLLRTLAFTRSVYGASNPGPML
jgi:hypothetical protein